MGLYRSMCLGCCEAIEFTLEKGWHHADSGKRECAPVNPDADRRLATQEETS